MQNKRSKKTITSNNSENCLWMDEGPVAPTVCDRLFECETCPLDEVMRKEAALADAPPLSSLHPPGVEKEMETSMTPLEHFGHKLDEFVRPILSVQLPSDRWYHPCHLWVKDESPSTSTLGIDHIGAYFLQPIVSVVLLQTPSRVEYDSPCAWLVTREGTIALRSAVPGIAVETNATLVDHPYLLLDDPYGAGWILKVTKLEDKKRRSELLPAQDYTPLLVQEVETVKEKFISSFKKCQPGVGSTLYDGGEPLQTIQEILGAKKYFDVISRSFVKK